MPLRLLELTTEGDRMVTSLSQEQGSAEATFRLSGANATTPPTVAELNATFDLFTGGVGNLAPALSSFSPGGSTPGAGKINRFLPPDHPFRPELSASGVRSCVGVGQHVTGDAVQILGLNNPVTFPHWYDYDFRVQYDKRPYFHMPDSYIGVYPTAYHKPDGSVAAPVYYADEWKRYTKWTKRPLADTATNSYGQSTFKTASGLDPQARQYDGQAYMNLKNEIVEVMWYQVPYRYFLDFDANLGQSGTPVYKSYLNRFVGTVNQYPINGYGAGRLLYLGAEADQYVPASPKRSTILFNALNTALDQSLMCNIKLRFLATTREGTDVPDYATSPLFTRKNNIPNGHNLLPNFQTRKFYYCVGGLETDPDELRPATFESFPFELFFTDPLLLQPGSIF